MSNGPKQAIYTEFAAVARALGHPYRLELIEHLAQGERAVEALARRTGLSVANTSQHLHQLRRAGVVVSRREGRYMIYRLSDDNVLSLFAALRQVAERNVAEIDRILHSYFTALDDLEPVSRETLLQRLQDGAVTVLDVRPPEEFAVGHLPGAVNVPLETLEQQLGSLDPAQDVVAYCRGAYCVLSFEAVAALRERGFTVQRLEDGFPEWRAAGLPVETGS